MAINYWIFLLELNILFVNDKHERNLNQKNKEDNHECSELSEYLKPGWPILVLPHNI